MHQDATWYGGRPHSSRLCDRYGSSFTSPKRAQPPIFVQCPLWPNDWMDEDATWYGSRPLPQATLYQTESQLCTKVAQQLPHLFGPCLLWPRSPISAIAELLFYQIMSWLLLLRQCRSDAKASCCSTLQHFGRGYLYEINSFDEK